MGVGDCITCHANVVGNYLKKNHSKRNVNNNNL